MSLRSAAIPTILVCLASLLGGCSKVRFAYNHLDWFLLRRADRFFDFDKAQRAAFEADLREYLSWHRRVMLPRYADHLRKSADAFGREPVDRAAYDRLGEDFETLMKDTVVPALPAVARAMRRMSSKQVDRFERKLEESEDDVRERLRGDREDRAKRMTANLSRMFTLFLVRLSHDQKEHMTGFLKEKAGSPQPWLKDREAKRKELVAMIRAGASEQELVARMRAWVLDPKKGRPSEYQESYDRFRATMSDLLYATISAMQGRQRERFVERLREHASTFDELAKEGAPAPAPGAAPTPASASG